MNSVETEARKLKKWRDNARQDTIRPPQKPENQSTLTEATQ